MVSKFDRLRAGEVVEIEPGRKGKLNLKDKTFETSDGRKVFVGDDPDFFPQGQEGLKVSQQKENLRKEINKSPFGEFGYQFGEQGLAGSAKNWVNKLTQKGDDYQRTKRVNQEVSEEISEQSPYTSGAATAASFIPDFALTKGMSATKAAPLLTGLHAGPRTIEEPGEVAKDVALSAGGGFLIDKAAGWLGNVAKRRGESRAIPGKQLQVAEQNAMGQRATQEANDIQTQAYNKEKEFVRNQNEARLHQHNLEVTDRQNRMIEAQNAYQNSIGATKSEASRLGDEFKLAKSHYDESLKKIPELQKKAQQEYSQNVIQNAEKISKSFPENSKIYSSQFNSDEFIDESIAKSGLAGSKEANQASKIIKSIFPEGEILAGKDLASRYKALEDSIQRASPEVKGILTKFKSHIGDRLTPILADNIAYKKIIPQFQREITREVNGIIKDMHLPQTGIGSESFVLKRADSNINQIFRELSPEDFINRVQNGQIKETILNNVLKGDDFTFSTAGLKGGKKGMNLTRKEAEALGINLESPAHQDFLNRFKSRLDQSLSKAEQKMIAVDAEAALKLGPKIKKTMGIAEPVEIPQPPAAPQLPQAPLPPQVPQMPIPASKSGEPMGAIPNRFEPAPIPTLPPAQGLTESAADLLETNPLKSKGGGALEKFGGPLAKLAGLKYALGNATLPVEAGYLAMKGLTSPTQAGAAARATFKQAGIQAIESWAQKYPSYHDGILENPMDRRSLTKEIEDDYEIPIEQKAVIQSKVNRGKPLQQKL